jgi:hypothetical protein
VNCWDPLEALNHNVLGDEERDGLKMRVLQVHLQRGQSAAAVREATRAYEGHTIMKLQNQVFLRNGYAEILVSNGTYKHTVLIDIGDLEKIGKIRISNTGYAYQAQKNGKSIASVILDIRTTPQGPYIDHVNGRTLDNRRQNLRVCTPSENARNRRKFTRNNSGTVGIAYREVGQYHYYRVSFTSLDGKRFSRQFNINKLGKSEAFARAAACLEEAKKQHGYAL